MGIAASLAGVTVDAGGQVVLDSTASRVLDVATLALRAEEVFGRERVRWAPTVPDAIETAIALVEDAGGGAAGAAGAGIVVTGSVVTAGAARTLFGMDPQ